MAETKVRIHPEIRRLLASPSPDIEPLLAPETGRPVGINESRRLLDQVYDFLQQHGNPPLDRLGLQRGFYVPHYPKRRAAKRVLMFFGGQAAIINEELATPEQTRATFDHMVGWAERSPLRAFSFPFLDRVVTMHVTSPAAEAEARLMSRFILFEKARALPLSEVKPENCLIAVGSDSWVNPETGHPRWLGAYQRRDGITTAGEVPFNRLASRCFRGVLALAQREVRNHPRPTT